MNIREDSKKIVQHFLEKAIEYGDFDLSSTNDTFSYNSLAETLGLESGRYCRVCCLYLRGQSHIVTFAKKEDDNIYNVRRSIRLLSSAVDFLESD